MKVLHPFFSNNLRLITALGDWIGSTLKGGIALVMS